MEIIQELYDLEYSLMNCNVKKQPIVDKWSSISLKQLHTHQLRIMEDGEFDIDIRQKLIM